MPKKMYGIKFLKGVDSLLSLLYRIFKKETYVLQIFILKFKEK